MTLTTTRASIAAICAVLITTGSWAGQDQAAPPLAIADIIATIGSDADAHNVMAKVLTHAMASRGRREIFLANQIRNEWLPEVAGVEFVRLADTEITGYLSRCGTYWVVSHLERVNNVVSMVLDQKCGGTALFYIVSFDGSEWRLGPPGTGKDGRGWAPGIASGIVGRPPGCPCLDR